MSRSARTDVHAPSQLVTEDYRFVGLYDAESPSQHRMELINRLRAEGYRFANIHPSGQCDHCGAHIRYVALMLHTPTGQLLQVGETCLDNRFARATAEFHALRKQAELDRKEFRIRNLREQFISDHLDLYEFLSANTSNVFYSSLLHAIQRYGNLTEAQLEAAYRSRTKYEEIQRSRAIEAEIAVPVVTGVGVQITGFIRSVKWQESSFNRNGGTLKMLVVDDRGFKVWGTVPSFKHEGECSLGCCHNASLAGSRVTFIANVEASEKDQSFGFFSRPRKAAITMPEVK